MRRALLAVLSAASLAPAAQAQERLSLPDALERGHRHSLRLAEMEARVDAAAASEAGRRAADRPLVVALAGYTRTNHVQEFVIAAVGGGPLRPLYPDVPDNYRARLDLQWPIYSGGRAEALVAAARAERAATGADLSTARADLRLEITRAFWALVTARESESVLDRSLASLDSHLQDVRSRLKEGLVPPNEVLSAEARQSRGRVLALEARNLRASVEVDLRRLLGDDGAGALVPELPADGVEGAADPAALVEEALRQRPERQAFQDRLAASRARERAARASARPQIGVVGGYDYARPNPRIFPRVEAWEDSWDVSVNVSWSLWDGGRRRAEEAEAAAAARVVEARAGEFDRQIALDVRQRWLEADSSRAAIAAAADGVRAALEARRVLQERYAAGVATSTEVLDAETAVLQAELDHTRAVAGERLARARLDRAVGR
jgi:outer membrane protein TolC